MTTALLRTPRQPPVALKHWFPTGIRGAWTSNTLHAVYYNGKTYFGYTDHDGNVRVSSFNHSTRAVVTSPAIVAVTPADMHNAPSIVIRNSDQKLVLAVAGHDSTSIYVAISTNAEDVSAWGAATDIDPSLGGIKYTYANLFQLSGESDKLYLFYRELDSGTPATGRLTYSTSTDGGATWAAQTVLFTAAGKQGYSAIGSDNASRIDFVVTDGAAQNGDTASLYHFYYSGGSFYKSDGTAIVVAKPYGVGNVTKVFDAATLGSVGTSPYSMMTNGGDPIAVWPAYNTAGAGSNSNYWYGTCTAGAWTVNEIDDSGVPPSVPYFEGSLALDRIDPAKVYVSKVVSSLYQMYLYETGDGGSSWTVTPLTDDTSEANLRPTAPVNADAALRVFWLYGRLASDLLPPTFSTEIRAYPSTAI